MQYQTRLPLHIAAMKPKPKPRLRVLRDHDIQFFMTYGYVKIPGCFTRLQCEMMMGDLWRRMGVSPDKRTWHSERVDVPWTQSFNIDQFAPKARNVIYDLLEEGRVDEDCLGWGDDLIVNLGTPMGEGKVIRPDGWHVDGDNFAHFLDSPEQALLMITLFTDVQPNAGGTALCPAALAEVAQFLLEHPEGVSPHLVPRAEDPNWNRTPTRWRIGEIMERMPSNTFVEATGHAGDVYFIHPLMPHSATNNSRRELRVINNPGANLREPFNFNRHDGNYSIVELTTLHHLGRRNLPGWRATGSRDKIVPEREREQELSRLQATKPTYMARLYLPPSP